MLLHGKNLTVSANELEWNGKQWSIVNRCISFTEAEVGAPARFESDFMVQYLAQLGYVSAPHPSLLPASREKEQQPPLPAGGERIEVRGERGLSTEAVAVLNAGR